MNLRTFLPLLLCVCTVFVPAHAGDPDKTWALAIHGGAGVIERGDLTADKEIAYRAALLAAMDAGSAVLRRGGSSLDAVEATIRVLEDDPLFNAGRGAVFTADGRNELDASIMDGATRKAGAVAGVTRTRTPSASRERSWRSRRTSCWRAKAPTSFRWSRVFRRSTRVLPHRAALATVARLAPRQREAARSHALARHRRRGRHRR